MATTAMSVLILAIIVRITMPGYDLYFTRTVLESFAANVVIHIGLKVTRKYESIFFAAEVLLDTLYTIAVLVIFGFVFGWFGTIPVGTLAAIAVIIHLVGLLLSLSRMRGDADTINGLIDKRKKKQSKNRECMK